MTAVSSRAEGLQRIGAGFSLFCQAMIDAVRGLYLMLSGCARIAAEAALEEIAQGKSVADVTPFWRVIDEKSPVAKRLPCGPEFIELRRQLECGSAVSVS